VMGADGTVTRAKRVVGTRDLETPTTTPSIDHEQGDPSTEDPSIDPGTLVDRFKGDRAAMIGDVDPNELSPDVVDDLESEGATVVELASGERSFRFGHVIVDEAQDLSAMQWRMIIRRAEPGCLTAVGDLAQRTIAPAQKWDDILPDIGPVNEMRLTINYRSPAEVLVPAAKVLERYAPELEMPRALRSSQIPTELILERDRPLGETILGVLRTHRDDGPRTVACICPDSIGSHVEAATAASAAEAINLGYELITVRSSECRGLEFDASLIIEPGLFGETPRGLANLFVALTRSTQWSAVITSRPIPAGLVDIFD
ncbi:MAG: hypothetical protein ACN4GZ_05710, partial [Acidimicrobiales bacterium]